MTSCDWWHHMWFRQTSQKYPTVREETLGPWWKHFWLIGCWIDDDIDADLSGTHRNRHVYEKISYKIRNMVPQLLGCLPDQDKVSQSTVPENKTTPLDRKEPSLFISNTSTNAWEYYLVEAYRYGKSSDQQRCFGVYLF